MYTRGSYSPAKCEYGPSENYTGLCNPPHADTLSDPDNEVDLSLGTCPNGKKYYLDEKDQIVDKHNELRNELAKGLVGGLPGATDMYQMRWDDALADYAKTHTELCEF